MKLKTRFIQSVIAAAQQCDTPLPWAKGPAKPAKPSRSA